MSGRSRFYVSLGLIATAVVAGLLTVGIRYQQKEAIRHNLVMLQEVWLMYANSRSGGHPASISEMLVDFQITPEKVLTDPITGRPQADRYIMLVSPATTLPTGTAVPLFAYNAKNGRYVVTTDGKVSWQPQP